MPAINIYIPEELASAMVLAKDINWSQVAQAAFRKALLEKQGWLQEARKAMELVYKEGSL